MLHTFFAAPTQHALLASFLAGLATLIGGVIVVRMERTNPCHIAFGLAFAAGAMVYVSLVRLIPTAQSTLTAHFGSATTAGLVSAGLFMAGMGLLVALDRLLPYPEAATPPNAAPAQDVTCCADHAAAQRQKRMLRVGLVSGIAITAHNIPEGFATFFSMLESPHLGIPVTVAIAIHNIPEGVCIALPIYYATASWRKALLATLLSGMAEPLGALLGYALLAPFMSELAIALALCSISGIMVFISLNELLPSAREHSPHNEMMYGLISGMGLMALSMAILH